MTEDYPTTMVYPPYAEPCVTEQLISSARRFFRIPDMAFDCGIMRVECESDDYPGQRLAVYLIEIESCPKKDDLHFLFMIKSDQKDSVLGKLEVFLQRGDGSSTKVDPTSSVEDALK